MSNENLGLKKDRWDKAYIIGTILIPIMLAYIGYLLKGKEFQISNAQFQISNAQLDINKRSYEFSIKKVQVEEIESNSKLLGYTKDNKSGINNNLKGRLLAYLMQEDTYVSSLEKLYSLLNQTPTANNATNPMFSVLAYFPRSALLREGESLQSRDSNIKVHVQDVSGHGSSTLLILYGKNGKDDFEIIEIKKKEKRKKDEGIAILSSYVGKQRSLCLLGNMYKVTVEKFYGNEEKSIDLSIIKAKDKFNDKDCINVSNVDG